MLVALNALLIYSLQQLPKGCLWMIKQKVQRSNLFKLKSQGPGLEPKSSSSNPPCSTVDVVNFNKNTALYYSDTILHWHFWKTIDKGNSETFAKNSWRISRN